MRKLVLLGLVQALLLLSGCGGGGSGSVVTPTSNNGSGGGNQVPNAITMVVDSGPNGNDVDTPFISVTVCAPGSTANCQQIDHVEVDTGSYGLRIMSSVLSSSLAAAFRQEESTNGNSVVECTEFADGFSWGPVKIADVRIAGEAASIVPIQVIGDPAYAPPPSTAGGVSPEIPTACSSNAPEEDTVKSFGANGIIGIGVLAADCPSCAQAVSSGNNPGYYYECPASTWSPNNPCNPIQISQTAQVTDPVTLFQRDNNGVIVELQPAAEGASSDTGTLMFGIGTEGNNSLGAQTVFTASVPYGNITTTYTAQDGTQLVLPYSYFDTGSNAYYFTDDRIPSTLSCSHYGGYNSQQPDSWFCPSSELSLLATNTGLNGAQSPVQFSIGNAYTVFGSHPSGTVFDDLGASSGSQDGNCASASTASGSLDCAFDFGFPFFLGKSVYIAFVGANTSWGTGPYIAY
ncbi:MAG: DUF3443 family protein [Steroidobacterales bacterium]